MTEQKYTLKEKLEIAESIVTIIMFLMAIWGTVTAYEAGFWHKINHIVTRYQEDMDKIKTAPEIKHIEQKLEQKLDKFDAQQQTNHTTDKRKAKID